MRNIDDLTLENITDWLDLELANTPGDTDKFHKLYKALDILSSIEEDEE